MNHVPEPTGSLDQALAHASRLLATDPELAGVRATEILKAVENHPMALLVLGASRSACGNSQQAVEILGPLAESHAHWAMAHLELGIALGRAGYGERAVASLRYAVALKPDLPQAWLVLGAHLTAMGDAQAVDAAYASHIKFSTHDPELLKAAAALQNNRIPESEALLHERLKKAPSDVAAICMLAELAVKAGREDDAEQLLARCLELAPNFHAARQTYVQVLNRACKHQQALAEIESLLAIEPEHPGYRNLKAVILCRIGDYEQAIAVYDQILVEYPHRPRIWMSYGNALKTAGFLDRAIAAYRKSIALDPGSGETYWSMANLKTFRFSAEDLIAMRQQLQRSDLDTDRRLQFEFAVGKALEDAGEYAQSFQHYAWGNRLRREMVPYRANENTVRLQQAMRVYTCEFFRERAGHGDPTPDPIFIVGLPRTGSTLIEQILSSHSAVEGTMELSELLLLVDSLRRRSEAPATASYHEVLASLDAQGVRELGKAYLEGTRIHRKSEAPYFIDKMPNNFAHIGLIQLALPNAKIIDVRRHPMASCFSSFKQHFAGGQNFAYDLDDLGRYCADYVELMAHFDAALPDRIHRVIYEHLVVDTEAEVRRLLRYCDLPFEAGCLRFFENARAVSTPSSEQVRQPIYHQGIDHWRHFEPWLGPLKTALGATLDAYPAAPVF